jgi:hypothetical protein
LAGHSTWPLLSPPTEWMYYFDAEKFGKLLKDANSPIAFFLLFLSIGPFQNAAALLLTD